jgi:hypothetical protein
MLAQSMGRVGLIDITVGNAARLGAHRNVPPRDAARRTTSLRNARAAGHFPAAFARLARTVRLKRLWLREGMTFEGDPAQRTTDEKEFALRNDDGNAEGASSSHDHLVRVQ